MKEVFEAYEASVKQAEQEADVAVASFKARIGANREEALAAEKAAKDAAAAAEKAGAAAQNAATAPAEAAQLATAAKEAAAVAAGKTPADAEEAPTGSSSKAASTAGSAVPGTETSTASPKQQDEEATAGTTGKRKRDPPARMAVIRESDADKLATLRYSWHAFLPWGVSQDLQFRAEIWPVSSRHVAIRQLIAFLFRRSSLVLLFHLHPL